MPDDHSLNLPNPVLAVLKSLAGALRKHAYGRVALIIIACLLPFSIARLALFLIYHQDFRNMGLMQILSAFVEGLRFDLSVTIEGIFLPLLLMLLPFRWSHHVYWQRLWGWFIYIVLLLMVFMLSADAIYFGIVHRHVGTEIDAMSDDIAPMIALALGQYGLILLLFVVSGILGALLWRRVLYPLPAVPRRWWARMLGIAAVFVVFFAAGRGGWSGKPISVTDAFFSNSVAQGYLTLNGAFAVTHALNEGAPPHPHFMPEAEAVARTQNLLGGSSAPFTNKEYPIYRKLSVGKPDRKPNVVVLMLESWGALHVDAVRRAMNMPPLGVTPNFDQLAQQGRLYTNFYANGQRSIMGAEAILGGLPTLPGMPFLGSGLEQDSQSYLGELAESQGYATYFLQSSDRSSFHFDAIAARTGFSQYEGAEDIPELHAKPKPPYTWGTWDHNTFQEANRIFAASRKPFLGYIFTSTTHVPWIIPDDRWKKYTGDSNLDKFLNSLYYADWALGELIKSAKKSGYYDNTIFVLTADHANDFVEHTEYTPNLFHVPLLIVGPGVKPGVDQRIGSQFDMVPTIADLAGWNVSYGGMGRSLLDPQRIQERTAFCVRDSVITLISAKGYVSHDISHRLGTAPGMSKADADEMELDLQAEYQTITELLNENRIAPPIQTAPVNK